MTPNSAASFAPPELSQLVGMELESITKVTCRGQYTSCLRHAKRCAFAKDIAESGFSGEGRQHLLADACQVPLPPRLAAPVLWWYGVGAEKGGNDGGQAWDARQFEHDAEASYSVSRSRP